jgi:flagellar motility protein MotE (MotC chaperone)
MISSMRFRLLPAVFLGAAALLALKSHGLVRDARAESKPALHAAAQPRKAPQQSEESGDDISSAAEADVLTSLAKRRAELEARARDQVMRENLLAATEKRVDEKIGELKKLQAQMTVLLGQRDAAEAKQIASLVKTYSAMRPKDAARIFNGLSEEVLLTVAGQMKSDALAPVLAAMTPEAAQKLTVKLASRLTLPATASIGNASANPAEPAGKSASPAQTAAITAPTSATAPASEPNAQTSAQAAASSDAPAQLAPAQQPAPSAPAPDSHG